MTRMKAKMLKWGLATVTLAMVTGFLLPRLSRYPVYVTTKDGKRIEHRVCAAWLPAAPTDVPPGTDALERREPAGEREWWISVTRGEDQYRELRSAHRIEFEMDPGSGIRPVCAGKEVTFDDDASSLVSTLFKRCNPLLIAMPILGPSREQVAIHIRDWSPVCEEGPARILRPKER